MKSENKFNWWIIGGIVGVIIITLFYPGRISLKPGEGTSETETSEDSGINVFFADKNLNPLTPQLSDTGTQSVVSLQGYSPLSDVFFMRFDLKLTNTGSVSKSVYIKNIEIVDADGNPIEETIVTNAFSCILNRPKNIVAGGTYTFSTDTIKNPECGTGSWIPTLNFEKTKQPLKIKFTIKSEFVLFGVTRSAEIITELPLAISESSGAFGSVTAEIIGAQGTSSLKECTPGETQFCAGGDVAGSVCAGKSQTCTKGIWPGCPDSIYGSYYTPGKESNGNSLGNFKVTCKDGFDNDCDGVYDKPDIDGSCTRGNCDYDCPACIVTFRTNADIPTKGDTPSAYTLAGTWINVDEGGDYLVSYGRTSKTMVATDINSAYQYYLSPTGTVKIYRKDSSTLIVYLPNPSGSILEKYIVYEYKSGESTRCKVGDATYPNCIIKFRTQPYLLYNQERCVNY